MKQILVMMMAVVLVGCGKKDPNKAANKLYVDAVQLITSAKGKTGEAAIADYEEGLAKISKILSDHRESDLAVKLISGETLFKGNSLNEIKDKVAELKEELDPQAITNPVVVEAVRNVLKKPVGRLTESDLKRTRGLNLNNTQITDAGLKEVAKLQNLEQLMLNNTKITAAGLKEVAKLQKLNLLWLDGTKITDAGLKEVAKLQKLKSLWLDSTNLTRAGVDELQKALPNCEFTY